MEKFVNDVFKSSTDLSGLTHRIIRERYLTHTGHKECIGDEKAKLKALVERKMMEIIAKREHNTATQSPRQKADKKVTATKQKQPETVKKKSKKAVETSESDEESDEASEAISPPESPTSKESSDAFVMESSHNSSDFEEDSPVRKNIRRPAKRKRYFSDESDSNSDSGQNGTSQKVQKKESHNVQEKDAKRRNVKPPKSDSSDSDSSVKIGKAKRQKHGSGDGKKAELLGRRDTKSESGKGKRTATNKGSVKQSKKNENGSSGLDSEDTDDNDRLAIVTGSDSASSDVNTKVAQKTRKGKGDGFTSDESDATIVDENSSSGDTVGSGSDAVGSGSDAVGSGSDVVGSGSNRVGSGSGVVGSGSDAVGSGSGVVGSGSDAVGSGSGVVGSGSDAAGSGSDAAGSGSDAAGSGSDAAGSGSDAAGSGSDTVGSQSKKTPQTEGKKKPKLKAQICDSSETDSEAENVQEQKRRHGSGKEPKYAQNGKHGKGTAIKEKKKRPMVTASESDESDLSEGLDSNNSDGSNVDRDQEPATRNSRRDGEIFSEQITDEISSGAYSDTIRKRPTKRAEKKTSAKPQRLRKVSESSEDEIVDKTSRTKAGRRLADSDSDSGDDQHIPTKKHTSPAQNQKKPKEKLASGKLNQSKRLKKPDFQKKSKKHSVSSSDEELSDVSSETVMSKSSEKKDLAVRKKKPSGVKGRMVISQSEDSSSEDEQPLAKVKKETTARESSEDSDTGDSSSDANDGGTNHRDKQKKFNKTKQSKGSKPKGPSKKVANLKAILRACNAMPVGKRYKIMFGECETDAEFVKKLKKLLVAVGMTGRPSMKKAEDIRLKKELAELDTGSIISSKGRSLRDTRCSRFEYGAPVPEPMKRPTAPSCDTFKNLSGLVDSEGSDSST